jgi:hypothetical protein
LNPYAVFQKAKPTAQIDGGLFVFDGRFEIPLAAALAHAQRAEERLGAKAMEEALEHSEKSAALAPEAVRPLMVRGDVLVAAGRAGEARPLYEKALGIAESVEPEFQVYGAAVLREKLAALR